MPHSALDLPDHIAKSTVQLFGVDRLGQCVLTIRAATVASEDPLAALLTQSVRHGG